MTVPQNIVLLSIVIRPNTPDDARRLTRGLEQLTCEDSTIQTRLLEDHVVLGGISEEQLEIVIDRLKRDFHVNAGLGKPEVSYREAITRTADAEVKHVRQTDGRGEYAQVKIRLHPGDLGTGYRFENRVTGGAIPAQFIESVDRGIQDRLTHGVVAGYPVEDVRVVLDDGSYHDVDSSEAAFRTAGFLAAEEGLRRGNPVLLEPVMDLEVVVPADYGREITNDLVARRGHIQSVEHEGETKIIRAVVPLAGLFGYAIDLRTRTLGRGTRSMQFHSYMPYRSGDDERDDSLVGAPVRPRPRPRSSAVSLPEPDEEGGMH